MGATERVAWLEENRQIAERLREAALLLRAQGANPFRANAYLKAADSVAGLAFSLGIVDKLTPGELTGGRHVAATGTIDPDGTVGGIGGIAQKMAGAVSAGATFFLAPRSNCDEVVGHVPDGLTVAAVGAIDAAIAALDDYTAGRAAPSCDATS